MNKPRCEEVILQLVVRTYDDAGRPVNEQVSQQIKVFRNAETRDFWGGVVDKTLDAMVQQAKAQQPVAPTSPAPTPAPVVPLKKRGRG